MILNKIKASSFIALIITFVLAFVGRLFENYYIIWLSIIVFYLVFFLYSIKQRDKTIVLMGYLISFFVFLLGRYVIQFFCGRIEPFLEKEVFLEESIYAYLSLAFLFIGHTIFEKKRKITDSKENQLYLIDYNKSTKKIGAISRQCFYICVIFSLVYNMDMAIQSIGNIYTVSSAVSRMPFFLQKIGQMSNMFYWCFLSTLPSRNKTKIPTILFVISVSLTLLTGVRGIAVCNIMAVCLYYIFRQMCRGKLQDESIWISKRIKWLVVFLIPAVIVALGIFADVRQGNGIRFTGIINGIIYFFEQQGGSIDVIGRTIVSQNQGLLPSTNNTYTFGPIINVIREGIIGKALGVSINFGDGQTELLATHGNNLGATLTYIFDSDYFYNGGGFGTCYIAELLADFGIVGIIIYNLFLGWLINNINYYMSSKWWLNAISFLIIVNIFFLPRDFSLTFVNSILSTTNILPIVFLLLMSSFNKNLYKGDSSFHECC